MSNRDDNILLADIIVAIEKIEGDSDIDLLVVLDKETLPRTFKERSANFHLVSRTIRDIEKIQRTHHLLTLKKAVEATHLSDLDEDMLSPISYCLLLNGCILYSLKSEVTNGYRKSFIKTAKIQGYSSTGIRY